MREPSENSTTLQNALGTADSGNDSGSAIMHHWPLSLTLNQDSIWSSHRDSLIKQKFSGTKSPKDYAVGLNTGQGSPVYIRGEFSEHLLKVKSGSPRLIHKSEQDFTTIVVFALLFIFGVLSMVYRKRVQILFSAFLLRRIANQIQREENALSQRVSVLLSVTFLISATLLLQRIFQIRGIDLHFGHGIYSFLILLCLVVFYYLIKILIHKIAAFLLRLEREINDYLFNLFLGHQIGGLVLFAIAMVSTYIKPVNTSLVSNATLGVFALMFIFQTIRGVSAVRFEGLNTFFYIFLYFCILEVLPLIILIKMIYA